MLNKNEKLIRIKKETLFGLLLFVLAVGVGFGHVWHMGQMAGL